MFCDKIGWFGKFSDGEKGFGVRGLGLGVWGQGYKKGGWGLGVWCSGNIGMMLQVVLIG